MSTRYTMSAIGTFLDIFGSAIAASRAVQSSRAPRASDLRALGIDPATFARIGRR